MDDILQTDHIPSKMFLHLCVGLDLHSLLPHLPEQLLVDQLTHQLLRRLSPSYVVLDTAQLSNIRWCSSNKNGCVDTTEVELIQDDFLLFGDISHSTDPNNQ